MIRVKVFVCAGIILMSVLSMIGCDWFAGPPELTLQTIALGAPSKSVARSLPPNTDQSSSIAQFAASRFEVYVSEITSGGIGEKVHLFKQEQTLLGPRPVFFTSNASPLEGLNVDELPSSVGIVYVWASAFLVHNGTEWFGTIYGADTTMISSDRSIHGDSGFALADMNFYEDPGTLAPVEFVEYHVAFVDADEIDLNNGSYLLHYHKTAGHGDNDLSNDVWDFGSLSEDSPVRTAAVSFLSGTPYEFAGAESTATDDVYILLVPMPRITLQPGDPVVVTISVEMEDLVGEIYTGDSITDTAAVRYTLDSNRAPISFSIAID